MRGYLKEYVYLYSYLHYPNCLLELTSAIATYCSFFYSNRLCDSHSGQDKVIWNPDH